MFFLIHAWDYWKLTSLSLSLPDAFTIIMFFDFFFTWRNSNFWMNAESYVPLQ